MSRQYKRAYRLAISGESSAVEITGLRINFEVTKDLQGFPNLARIDVFNLSKDSRAKIENEFDNIALNVGYEGNVKLLFDGQIKNVTHLKLGEDAVTTIYAGDGQKDWEESFSSFTLAEGATVEDLVRRLTSDFKNASLDIIQDLVEGKDKLLGFSTSAPTSDTMDQLADEYNFDWSIQNSQVNIIDRGSVVDQVFKISAATGMIGSPAVTEIGANVTFLLNPEILPGRIIEIESLGSNVAISNLQFRQVSKTTAAGRYKVLKLVYTGDTHTEQWYTTATGKTA